LLSSSTIACASPAGLVVVDRKSGAALPVTSTTGPLDVLIASRDHFVGLQSFDLRVFDARGTIRASAHLLPGPAWGFGGRVMTASPEGYCYVTFDAPDFHVRCFDLDAKPVRTIKLALSRPTDPPGTHMGPQVMGPRYIVVGTFSFGGFPAARRSAVVRLADGAIVATVEDEVVAVAERSDGSLEGLVVAAPEIRLLTPSGAPRWTHPVPYAEPMAQAVVEGQDLIVARYDPIATGVEIVALRLSDGKQVWKGETRLPSIGHSKYRNDVTLVLRPGAVILRGEESSVHHVHLYDPKTGALRFHDAPHR
jgi:hypothetical protein